MTGNKPSIRQRLWGGSALAPSPATPNRSHNQPGRVSMKTSLSSTSVQVCAAAALLIAAQIGIASSTVNAVDPGPRAPDNSAGAPLAGLSQHQLEYFNAGLEDFAEAEDVGDGLGPRMNLDSCGGCHSQPAIGGTSPAVNPQVAFATLGGGT